MARKTHYGPQTCAVHNPGSLDCNDGCSGRLRSHDAPGPGIRFALADGTFLGAPAPAPAPAPPAPAVGPETVEEMDDAVADIEERDDADDADEDADEDDADDEDEE